MSSVSLIQSVVYRRAVTSSSWSNRLRCWVNNFIYQNPVQEHRTDHKNHVESLWPSLLAWTWNNMRRHLKRAVHAIYTTQDKLGILKICICAPTSPNPQLILSCVFVKSLSYNAGWREAATKWFIYRCVVVDRWGTDKFSWKLQRGLFIISLM